MFHILFKNSFDNPNDLEIITDIQSDNHLDLEEIQILDLNPRFVQKYKKKLIIIAGTKESYAPKKSIN